MNFHIQTFGAVEGAQRDFIVQQSCFRPLPVCPVATGDWAVAFGLPLAHTWNGVRVLVCQLHCNLPERMYHCVSYGAHGEVRDQIVPARCLGKLPCELKGATPLEIHTCAAELLEPLTAIMDQPLEVVDPPQSDTSMDETEKSCTVSLGSSDSPFEFDKAADGCSRGLAKANSHGSKSKMSFNTNRIAIPICCY